MLFSEAEVGIAVKPCFAMAWRTRAGTSLASCADASGALMAKGFILGVQYDCLFTDDLFFRLAKHENEIAEYLVQELKKLNIRFFMDSPTNQQFIYLKNEVIEQLKKKYEFEMWEIGEEESVIRLVTSFMSKASDVDSLVSDLKELL